MPINALSVLYWNRLNKETNKKLSQTKSQKTASFYVLLYHVPAGEHWNSTTENQSYSFTTFKPCLPNFVTAHHNAESPCVCLSPTCPLWNSLCSKIHFQTVNLSKQRHHVGRHFQGHYKVSSQNLFLVALLLYKLSLYYWFTILCITQKSNWMEVMPGIGRNLPKRMNHGGTTLKPLNHQLLSGHFQKSFANRTVWNIARKEKASTELRQIKANMRAGKPQKKKTTSFCF